MKPIKNIIAPYVSVRAAALRFNVGAVKILLLTE